MKKIKQLLLILLTTLCVSAHAYVFTSTVQQSGFAGNLNNSGIELTASPFDFHGQPFDRITSIGNMWITLSVYDGDTDVGNFDFNSVFYFLNNYSLQTFANYFPDNTLKTFTQFKPGNSIFRDFFPQITQSIKNTGLATITLRDFSIFSINYIELPSTYQATLKFEAVLAPVPEAPLDLMFLAGLVLLCLKLRIKNK